MSVETWKEEFYPKHAAAVEASPVKCTQHSLRKWRGLLQANLDAHEVQYTSRGIVDRVKPDQLPGQYFRVFTGFECALCLFAEGEESSKERLYSYPITEAMDRELPDGVLMEDHLEDQGLCAYCPLFRANGVSCDDDDSPYVKAGYGDPTEMIEALELALIEARKMRRKRKKNG